MAGIGKYKLSDAIPKAKPGGRKGDKSGIKMQKTAAEQAREVQEAHKARSAGASRKERSTGIGRGGQQAGRQGAS